MSAVSLSPPQPESLAALRAEVVRLFEETRAFDIREIEDETSLEVVAPFAQRVRDQVKKTLELAEHLSRRYDTPSADATTTEGVSDFGLALDRLLADERGENKVGDVAFMAGIELRQRLARLDASPSAGTWERVCDCGSGLRRVLKTLSALDLAVADVERQPRLLSYDSEIEIGLKTRRLYRKLWSFVAKTPEPQGPAVGAVLRGAGTLIAMLVGRNEYSRFRETDRRQLRDLQRRILRWMTDAASDARAGARLWEDFAGFAGMLRQINFRQELVQHDGEVLGMLERSLSLLPPEGTLPSGTRAVFKQLEGLDDGIDAAVAEGAPVSAVLSEVLRAAARFAPPPPTPLPSPNSELL